MLRIYKPTESELMDQARKALAARSNGAGLRCGSASAALARDWEGTAEQEDGAGRKNREARRLRSLRSCHHYTLSERPRFEPPADSGAFVPAASAGVENDRNLTDGARRCARKIMEEAYRQNRAGRVLSVTVSYLGRGLGRCRRTIQYYLRLLERAGYIEVAVVKGSRSRLCTGLTIRLLEPLFPRHHRKKWPAQPRFPGVQSDSQNQRFIDSNKEKTEEIPVAVWAIRCMDGVFRGLMKTNPLCGSAIPISK